jgi:hypothetical protein
LYKLKRRQDNKCSKINIYNIDREFDYVTAKSIVVKSLEKMAKEEALKNIHNDVIFDSKDNDDHRVNVNKLSAPPSTNDGGAATTSIAISRTSIQLVKPLEIKILEKMVSATNILWIGKTGVNYNKLLRVI